MFMMVPYHHLIDDRNSKQQKIFIGDSEQNLVIYDDLKHI